MNEPSLTFDEIIDRFEESWGVGEPLRIDDLLLPPGHPDQTRTLKELIKIDLEYRWRRVPMATKNQLDDHPPTLPTEKTPAASTFVEEYATRFPSVLEDGWIPIELIAEEYLIRQRWGDRPTTSSYIVRFPDQTTEVQKALKAVDLHLASRHSFVDTRLAGRDHETQSTNVPANRHTLSVGQQIDDFRLLNELGHGAFARVFLAQQVSMQRLVALKVSDQKSLESPVLSQLEHPNIVRVFDERHVGSMYLMYMQYVSGGSLRDAIDRLAGVFDHERNGLRYLKVISDKLQAKGETSTRETASNSFATLDWASTVASIGARIADALSHAHGLGVLHRDIKPENILLTSNGQPMLADFNLSFGASVIGASAEDSFGGSFAYMSPEHIRVLLGDCPAETVNESSDIFSLGIVLYELLVGRRPFEQGRDLSEPNWTKLNHLLARQNCPSPSQPPGHADQGLYAFVLQCLAYAPSDRPASASQASRRLQLLSIPRIKLLLSPATNTWFAYWTKHPIVWYLLLGMVPNALMSPLNIWANHRIAIENFDLDFFHYTEEPVVNLIAFPLGLLVAWWFAFPISKAITHRPVEARLDESTRSQAAKRCLKLPAITAVLVLTLWVLSGLVFPWWNQWASGSRVSPIDFLGFFLSQVLHGAIAACLSLVFVCLISLRSFYARLIPIDANESEQLQLGRLDQQLSWANACLEMTPLFAILTISLSDQFDKLVFVALALVGFLGHIVAAFLIPKLRATIESYQLAVGKSSELLRYGAR